MVFCKIITKKASSGTMQADFQKKIFTAAARLHRVVFKFSRLKTAPSKTNKSLKNIALHATLL